MQAAENKRRWLSGLIIVYIAGVAARYLIALLASRNPFIMPDEALYLNLARSIANGGGIALRNQPVTYTSLLYPLMISPVYALCPAGAQFRAVQLMGCFFMNLAVFPAYGIAKRVADAKMAFVIAAISILLPDMLLTSRAMTEAIEYPLFLLTVYLMFGKLSGEKKSLGWAALTGASTFLLTQSKAGSAALAIVFLGILIYGLIRTRRKEELKFALVFAGTYAVLTAALYFALYLSGMDFSQKSIYDTQLQAPTLDHLKKTLPGLLLYVYFIPVAFGIYPLVFPASNLRLYEEAQKKQLLLALLALALYAGGACYMFFDTETIGNYFAGRIHIRYVFMFLPVFLAFATSPRLDKAKPNGRLIAALGFLLAMTVTVSFSALLSNRRYPVDAISLSYIIYDDSVLNWRLLSQVAMVTFMIGMLALIWRRGWGKAVKRACAICLALGVLTANWLGYDLNEYNNASALADDARQAAQELSGEDVLLVPDSGLYFDNTLSVLDTAMSDAPYEALYDDLCAALGSYGTLESAIPPKYWTEKPVNPYPGEAKAVFNTSAFSKMVLARGAQVEYTDHGIYAIVTPSKEGRLFHSALTGVSAAGDPAEGAALFVYDEALLLSGSVRVYLQVSCGSASQLTLSDGTVSFDYPLDTGSGWIYGDFTPQPDAAALKITIAVKSGTPAILTYQVE